MFRKFLMASVGAVALTGSAALAADLPMRAPPPVYAPAPYSWTGLYLGGQIGYAWDNDRANANSVLFVPGPPGVVPIFVPVFASAPFSYNPQGVIGGAHIGYNLQINQWLLGFEGTVDGTSISKTVGTFGVTDSFHAPVQGSIRARAGVAFDRVLLYVTGGAAFTGIKNSYTTTTLVGGVPLFLNEQISKTRAGWTVGAGLEYAVTNNWSVRAEYRYSDFGRTPDYPFAAFVPAGGAFSVQHHLTQNQVQVGFSYKFDTLAPAPVVAKY